MGNAQKKLRIRKGKDIKGKHSLSGIENDETNIQYLLSKGPIEDSYEVNPNGVLGRGHYAVVNIGICKRTKRNVAVKRIQICKSRIEALQREVQVLKKIGEHPNIVTLYDIFVTNSELQLVMELLRGGELFERMVEKGPYSEREASHHIRKIGRALLFLHQNGIVHRDLKPENLILTDKTDQAELKIADFGLSQIVEDTSNSTMQTVCGTWAYCAPEVKTTVKRTANNQGIANYTASVDCWSLGVILFVILGAYHPFDPDGDASDVVLWERICSGIFTFNDPAWDNISGLAKDLIKRLIVVDPKLRYTTQEVLCHPWITLTANVPATPITPSIDKSLGGFVTTRKRIQTPKPGGISVFQNYPSSGAIMSQASSKQAKMLSSSPQLGINSFAQPPHPEFTQNQIEQESFQPQVHCVSETSCQNIMKHDLPNLGLTLDTGVCNQRNDPMEISSPSCNN